MVPIHPLGLLAPSTLYTSQEISLSLTTSSQGLTNKRSYKNPSTRTLNLNDTKKTTIEMCTKDMQVLEQWCTQKHSSNAQIYSRKVWEG